MGPKGALGISDDHSLLRAAWLLHLLFLLRKDVSDWSESANGSPQADALSLESASKEAYFSRVETFTISFLVLSCQPPPTLLHCHPPCAFPASPTFREAFLWPSKPYSTCNSVGLLGLILNSSTR